MLVAHPLTHPWTLRHDGPVTPSQLEEGAVFAAQVPGCVHSDLLAVGAIPDPFLDRNETEIGWVGRTGWRYDTTLSDAFEGHERTDLVFEGLDTFARVSVAGRQVGESQNMHRGYRWDISGQVGAEGVPLTVRFADAYSEADKVREEVGARPNVYPEPFNYVRKMASSFGWDWGPTVVTAGIWRPVRLESWSTARLAQVRPQVTVDGSTGTVRVQADLERTATGRSRSLRLRVSAGGQSATLDLSPEQDTAELRLQVQDVELWWPHSLGAQPRYETLVELLDPAADTVLDTWSRRLGFRTVALDTTADEHGSAFTIKVNGVPVFARGVNWIPDDVLPSRITPERYRLRLEQAKAANVDLVRIWGGGIYEDRAFYDACDELGLLVWQDFLFACAAYPEEGPLPAEVEAEARENVVRLMPHPSLVLWNGNNENLWGFEDWDWKPELDGATWGRGYYFDLLPRVVAELDPSRPYWAGSPWSGSTNLHPNDSRHGTTHLWEAWNRRDYADYLTDVPRFVAEFGWQAPPALATIERSVSDRPLASDSPGMLHHQKAEDGNGKLARGLAPHFADPADFDTWHYLTQLNQARAIATGIEHWRANWPRCAGSIVWQLNDCWPVTSWAAIDGDGHLKPLYFELQRLYADRLLTFTTDGGRIRLAAVNQGARPWNAPVELRRVAADGTTTARFTTTVEAAERSVAHVELPSELTCDADRAKEFWVADADGLRALHFAAADRDFAYPQAEFDVTVDTREHDTLITVTARTLLRDLLLRADRLDPAAATDRGRITLLPGEQAAFTVTGWDSPGIHAARRALRCVNGLSPEHA
ncbi:glycoside hydrolase family 2 protein [Streptacidiphilus cavernicola]|uniref:beta-mannosidase n=1 Tax=Streptacidiphilus cavernicola TaxID=3342716 RepID=A0ABV6VMZ3_9ACTN